RRSRFWFHAPGVLIFPRAKIFPMPASLRFSSSFFLALASFVARAGDAAPRSDWIDPDTGHRVIRLSTDPGSQTLYFHDNSYSPEGDKLVFTSPSGIWLLDLKQLGQQAPQPELVVPGAGGAYMARRTREVYFTPGRGRGLGARASGPQGKAGEAPTVPVATPPAADAGGGGRGRGGFGFGGGEVFAFNYDTKETRKVPHAARPLINCDETFTLATIMAEDPTGRTPKPPQREAVPQLQRMFPGKKMEDLTEDQRYAVIKEDGL